MTATVRSPVAGIDAVTRFPVRSVTQSMLSGPRSSSHGPSSPDTSTFLWNCLVPRVTESGPSWAEIAPKNAKHNRKAPAKEECFIGSSEAPGANRESVAF